MTSETPALTGSAQTPIVLNGKDVTIAHGASVSALLEERGLQGKMVVVELNGTIVDRTAFAATALNPGDRLEIVHFVGGG